ncbi:MFS transporter [Kribbella sp. NPDC051770]|uniref:MFS transporter n=1 Tax=Kribbella sp. NPDC051770 TaxID=3155413 RepID=UPI003434E6F8
MTLPESAPATAAEVSALRLTARTPLYRGATLAMFLSGLGFSAAAPQIASFLVKDLGASLTVAGLFYLTNLTAPIAGYLVGARSDRTGSRLGLFRICAVVGFLSWTAVAFSTQLWMPFVISAVVGAFGGAAISQLFAAIHDETRAHPTPYDDSVVSIIRMALTAGWVVGPVAGAFLAAHTSLRVMLFATAVATLAQIVPLGFLQTPAASSPDQPAEPHHRPSLPAMLPLLTFTGLYVLVYAGESIKYAYLPIYMADELHFPAGLSGAVIGIQPLVELALMPLAVVVARRIGMLRLMVLGAAFGVGANLCFALTGTAAGLFAGQALMGGVWGIFAALGIIVAQNLLPGAVATASAIFLSSTAISSALGGATGGLGAAVVGLPHVFLFPATFTLLATLGLALMSRSAAQPRGMT